MFRAIVVGVAALALAACTHPTMPRDASITYETGPCFGRCPVYSLTLHPDGSGTFMGLRFTKVSGERAIHVTPAQYRMLAAKLAPWRPASGEVRYASGEARCGRAVTDLPTVRITWTRTRSDSQRLFYDFGCDRHKNAAIVQALGEVPDMLPLEGLIGAQP